MGEGRGEGATLKIVEAFAIRLVLLPPTLTLPHEGGGNKFNTAHD